MLLSISSNARQPIILFLLLSCFVNLSFQVHASPQQAESEQTQSEPAKSSEQSETMQQDGKGSATLAKDDQSAMSEQINNGNISAPVDSFEQKKADIKHYIMTDKLTPLLVGTTEYLTAVTKHTTAVNKGVLVLVPDWQQGIASPQVFQSLQTEMPKHGWTTIIVHPPKKPSSYPSSALEASKRVEEDTTSLNQYTTEFSAVLTALYQQAKNYPGVIVTVAQGSHAGLIVSAVQQELLPEPSALILLSAYFPTMLESQQLAQQIATSSYPILDLYLKRDNRFVARQVADRKSYAKNEFKANYRQQQLFNQVNGYYPKQSLTRATLGWLRAMGW